MIQEIFIHVHANRRVLSQILQNKNFVVRGGSCNFQPSIRGGSVNFEPRGRGGSLVLQPMISLADSRPLKTNLFSSTTGVLQNDISGTKAMPV